MKKYGNLKWVTGATTFEQQEDGFKDMCLALIKKAAANNAHGGSDGGYTVVSNGDVGLFCFLVQTHSVWAAREVKHFFKDRENQGKRLMILVSGDIGRFGDQAREQVESHVGVLLVRLDGEDYRFSYFDPNAFETKMGDTLDQGAIKVMNVGKDIVKLLCKRATPHIVPIITGENLESDCFREAIQYILKVLDGDELVFKGEAKILWLGAQKKYVLYTVDINLAHEYV